MKLIGNMRSLGTFCGRKLLWKDPVFIHYGNNKTKRCLVVIPFHKSIPNKEELSSLYQVINVLGDKYEIAMAHGESTDMSFYANLGITISEIIFSDDCFRSWQNYCSMLEMAEFYETFSRYDFILIYQLDAWIFYDRIEYFLNLEYDYIGAPHYVSDKLSVGNGGFSLRKIKSFISLCVKHKDEKIIGNIAEDRVFTEVFHNELKIPTLDIASEFALDYNPLGQYEKTLKFPMGGHDVKTRNGNTPYKYNLNDRWGFWRHFVDFDEVLRRNNCPYEIIKFYMPKPRIVEAEASVFVGKKRASSKRGNRTILRLR